MANSNSPLTNQVILISKKCYKAQASKKVTSEAPHHAAAVNASAKAIVACWEKRGSVSANYIIESNGRKTLVVNEKDRAYTTCTSRDGQAITIEVVNCKGAPYWEVSDSAIKSLIELSVDICKRNGMKGLTWTGDKKGSLYNHWMYASTACPGPYMKALMPWIAMEVSGRVAGTITGDIKVPKVSFSTVKTNTTTTAKKNTATTVNSTPKTVSHMYNGVDLSPVFDYKYYASHYIDLKDAYGFDEQLLFLHFCIYGMKEWRKATTTFDPIMYKNNNDDVKKEYGSNAIGYYAHYCLFGIKEGRKGY